MLEQRLDRRRPIVLGGEDQRRLTPFRLARVRVRALVEQRGDARQDRRAARRSAAVSRRSSSRRSTSAPALSSARTTGARSRLARDVQRRVAADARRRLDVRAAP